jgi:hypothetical protein
MKETIKELHIAAQYLAAAGISFIEKKADDSHTNLGWNRDKERMETHVFNADFKLGLNVNFPKLEWIKNEEVINYIELNGKSHKEISSWITEQAKQNNISKKYAYQFHYDLPYDEITDDYKFSLNTNELKNISSEFTKAQVAFEQFLAQNKLDFPIRIWPHHFDLGIYTKLDNETYMGGGLAIPDSLVDDFYFYASGYKNGNPIETKSFSKMEFGAWRSDWNGATLAASHLDEKRAVEFLNESRLKFTSVN